MQKRGESTRLLNYLRCAAAFAALLLVWSSGLWLKGPFMHSAVPQPHMAEDTEARREWFLSQRAYPNNSLPSKARRLAWEASARSRLAIQSDAAADPVWRSIGPRPTISAFAGNWGTTSGRVNCIAVSPANPQLILAGASTGGIWRSTNGGASFAPVSDGHVDLAVGWIAFSKSSPSIAYAGMGDTKLGYLGSGVLRSTDGGRSWSQASNSSLPSPGTVARIEVDPDDANRVYVSQFSMLSGNSATSSGFYLSTDGGVNWKRTLAGWARDFVIDPTDRKTIYAGIASRSEQDENAAPGVYRSTDSGSTWSKVYDSPYDAGRTRDVKLAITRSEPKTVYVYTGGFFGPSLDIRVLASTDQGQSWDDRGASNLDSGQFGYNTFITSDAANSNVVFAGARDLFKSTDGGFTWTNLTRNFTLFSAGLGFTPEQSKTHVDQHALAFSPSDAGTIYLGNDGGISKSTDGGNSFHSLNATLSLSQFVSIAVHPTDAAISYAGSQDNGAQRRIAGATQWQEFLSGDGGRIVIHPQSPSVVIATYTRGNIYRFFDDGRRFDRQVAHNGTFGEADPGARISFYAPFTGNRLDGTLYFGTWRLFISTDLGDTWQARAGETDLTRGETPSGRDVLTAIGVGPSNTNIIYTGSAQGRAMVSTDGGVSWSQSAGLPDRFITSITVDRDDSTLAYMTVSGFGSGHVFKTTDAGSSWSDISGNLPDIPTNALLVDPFNAAVLYAGTDIGVFRTTDGGNSWRSFNEGMPPVIVEAFAAQASGLVQVATYGRGAYEFKSSPSGGGQKPVISSATYDGKKVLVIRGEQFGSEPQVTVNNKNITSLIRSASGASIKLKGKRNKLGLKPGDNNITVSSGGLSSASFNLKIE